MLFQFCRRCDINNSVSYTKIDMATFAVKEESLQGEETDDPCRLKIANVVSLAIHADHMSAIERVSADVHDEVKQEDLEEEPVDVLEYLFYHRRKQLHRSLVTD